MLDRGFCSKHIPLLGLVPSGKKGNRDEDDNSLASVANLDLRILVSAYCCCPVPTASSVVDCRCVCVGDARERIVVFGSIIPREQRQTAEGAEKPSGQGHCSRGQSTPIVC